MVQNVTVTGSGNNVLVAAGDIYQIHVHLPPPEAQDRRNLLNLLERVRETWTTGVLERSVRQTALVEVGMRSIPGAVDQPWATGSDAPELLPPGTAIARVFDDALRTLLVLGGPGAGKTTALLTLAREWIGRAENDPTAPVPVVLNLSTWAGSRGGFHDWMLGELAVRYRVGRRMARRWLEEHRLLLLLDGLDEVVAAKRAACVEAIHSFVLDHGVPGLAVCCRLDEYRALPLRLKMGGAVSLLPLTAGQIDSSLETAGPAAQGLRSALDASAELRGLAGSPLMLNLMVAAFGGDPAEALAAGRAAGPDALRDACFTRYVDRMFELRQRPNGPARDRTERLLRWLASGMMRRGETIFAVELLQPAWLTPPQLFLYALLSRVAGGVTVAAGIGAVVCLGIYALVLVLDPPSRAVLATASAGDVGRVVGMYVGAAVAIGIALGLVHAPVDYLRLLRSRGVQPREVRIIPDLMLFLGYAAMSFAAAWLVGALGAALDLSPRAPYLWAGVITVLASALSFPLFFVQKPGRGAADADISLAGTLTWRWRSGLELAGVACASVAVLLPFSGRLGVNGPIVAAVAAVVTLLLVGYGSWRREVPPPDRWMHRTGATALLHGGRSWFVRGALAWAAVLFPILWSATGPWASPLAPLALAVLTAAVLVTPALLWFGGLDLVLHASLRLILSLSGATPLRLRRVLDHAVHLGFLQRAGGGYIFFHRLLLEHFAARSAPDGGAAKGHPLFSITGRSARTAGP